MRIFLSGPITGTDDAKSRFDAAARKVRKEHPEATVVNPYYAGWMLPDGEHEEYMRITLVLLDMCDAIYMMHGWEQSHGAGTAAEIWELMKLMEGRSDPEPVQEDAWQESAPKDEPETLEKPRAPRGRKQTQGIDWGKAMALRRAGWSYDKIGDELKVSGVTVAAHLKEMKEEAAE